MRSLSLCLCLWAWGFGEVAVAQPAGEPALEPDPVQIEAARRALRAEREQERLQLTDAWMKHEDQEERDNLRVSRWFMVASFAIFAGGWGVVAGANAVNDGPLGATVAASSAAAVSLGMAAALMLIEDERDAATLIPWAFVVELAMIATGFIVASAVDDDVTHDGALLYGALAGLTFAQAATMVVMTLAYPRVFVSSHYRDYVARPAATRAQHGLDLLLERERRQRAMAYGFFGIGVLQASVFSACAVAADRSEARAGMAVLAGITLVDATARLIIELVTRTPAESIVGGYPAPAPEAEAF